jgi:hypothetical protein
MHVCHGAGLEAAKLTVRLRDQRLYGLLKLLAAQRGVSMNRLVVEALAHELELQAALSVGRSQVRLSAGRPRAPLTATGPHPQHD